MIFIKNHDRDKYELDFDYTEYKTLDSEAKEYVKKYFLWSRATERWVSKAKIGGSGGLGFIMEKYVKPHVSEYSETEEGEKLTVVEKLKKTEAKDEGDKEYWLRVTPGYEPDYEKYAPPSSWDRRAESVQMYPHKYRKEYLDSVSGLLEEARKILKVSSDDLLPDAVKDAVMYHLKGIAEYQGKTLSAWEYAPSMILVGPGGYPPRKAEKGFERRIAALQHWKDSEDKFNERLQKIARIKFGYYNQNNALYLQNRIDEAIATAKKAQRAGNAEKATEYFELAKMYQDKVTTIGGKTYTKEILKEAKATHVKYGKRVYPIESLNEKTISIKNWGYAGGKFKLEYDRIQGFVSEPDAADAIKKQAPLKSRFNYKVGDLAAMDSGNGIRIYPITKVGIKYITLSGWSYGRPPEKLIPLETILDKIVEEVKVKIPVWREKSEWDFIRKTLIMNYIRGYANGEVLDQVYPMVIERLGDLELLDTPNLAMIKLKAKALAIKLKLMDMKISKCSSCGDERFSDQIVYYVDGNNIAITKNSKPYCKECYVKKYGPNK